MQTFVNDIKFWPLHDIILVFQYNFTKKYGEKLTICVAYVAGLRTHDPLNICLIPILPIRLAKSLQNMIV